MFTQLPIALRTAAAAASGRSCRSFTPHRFITSFRIAFRKAFGLSSSSRAYLSQISCALIRISRWIRFTSSWVTVTCRCRASISSIRFCMAAIMFPICFRYCPNSFTSSDITRPTGSAGTAPAVIPSEVEGSLATAAGRFSSPFIPPPPLRAPRPPGRSASCPPTFPAGSGSPQSGPCPPPWLPDPAASSRSRS